MVTSRTPTVITTSPVRLPVLVRRQHRLRCHQVRLPFTTSTSRTIGVLRNAGSGFPSKAQMRTVTEGVKEISSEDERLYDVEARLNFEVDPERLPESVMIKLLSIDGEFESEPVEFDFLPMTNEAPGGKSVYNIKVPKDFKPGLIIIENLDPLDDCFRLTTVRLTGQHLEEVNVPCYSWIEAKQGERFFFCSKPTLPDDTPSDLLGYRNQELETLKGKLGDAEEGERRNAPDRVYEFDVYNDLGKELANGIGSRPVLGGKDPGQSGVPFPRRYRTGRDVVDDKEVRDGDEPFYVPQDDDFRQEKKVDFEKKSKETEDIVKRDVGRALLRFNEYAHAGFLDFEDLEKFMFEDVERRVPYVYTEVWTRIMNVSGSNKEQYLRNVNCGFPELVLYWLLLDFDISVGLNLHCHPHSLWCSQREQLWKKDMHFADFEFGRQRIAGVNPCTIEAVNNISEVGPLDDNTLRDETTHYEQHNDALLEGKKLTERITEGRIFKVDYRTALLSLKQGENFVLYELHNDGKDSPLLKNFVYAPMCVLYLTDAGYMMPVAVDLVLPKSGEIGQVYTLEGGDSPKDWTGDGHEHRIYTPKDTPTEWAIAKGHFLVPDSAVHQLYSHFMRCHAHTEVYIIAARRQLSQLHPLHRLLMPHFKDTLRINANARKDLISAEGTIEQAFAGGKFSMVLASALYGANFRFKTEGLPRDLEKRGMAKIVEKDGKEVVEHVLKDYPYGMDGMLIWNAIEKWVTKYVDHYYDEENVLDDDRELRKWWADIKDQGHPDIVYHGYATTDEMWPDLASKKDLVYILTTIIWTASGHHAAINFGQYDFVGYMPSSPPRAVEPMPEKRGSPSQNLLDESQFLASMTQILQAAAVSGTTELLSFNHVDEEYLGDEIEGWFQEEAIEDARKAFRRDLEGVAKQIERANNNKDFPSRCSKLSIPYYLLSPYELEHTEAASGIPNSVSI